MRGAVADSYGFNFSMTAQCLGQPMVCKINDDHFVDSDPTDATPAHDR